MLNGMWDTGSGKYLFSNRDMFRDAIREHVEPGVRKGTFRDGFEVEISLLTDGARDDGWRIKEFKRDISIWPYGNLILISEDDDCMGSHRLRYCLKTTPETRLLKTAEELRSD